jgi:predicted permease
MLQPWRTVHSVNARGSRPLDGILSDIQSARRALWRAPTFFCVASLTLAVSIGAATAVFAVIDGVLIDPLPYPDAHALVSVRNLPLAATTAGETPLSATQFFTYREEGRVFEVFGVWSTGTVGVTAAGGTEQVVALRVTQGALDALGVHADIGRWFSPQDDAPGAPETVILSHAYWRRLSGGEDAVIGRTLTVDNRPRTVIGVMPAGFRFLRETPDVILPLRFDRNALVLGAFNYVGVGRLKPEVTQADAERDLSRLMPVWLRAWSPPRGSDAANFARRPALRPLKHDVVGDIGDVLWVLMGTVGMVLLIACANVANLLIVRTEARQQELAVRAALGAGWGRIARQLLIESTLVGIAGGVVGLALGVAGLRLLLAAAPEGLPRLTEIALSADVLAFAVAVSLLSSVCVGTIPLIRHAGPRLAPLLRQGGRTTTEGRQQLRARHTLVVVQVGLALVVLVAAGLMLRTYVGLRAVRPGFVEPASIQLARVAIPNTLIADPNHVVQMQSDIRDRLAAIPGVTSAAFASAAPMEPFIGANVLMGEGRTETPPTTRRFKFVSPGFFSTAGTPLVAGRDFAWSDVQQRARVSVVSEALAREMWGNAAAAVGKRIRENSEAPWREIVGVAGDVFDDGVHAEPPPTAYWPPVLEHFEGDAVRVRRSMTFVLRSSRAGSESLGREIQQAVWAVHTSLPVSRVQTLGTIYDASLARTSFTLVMLVVAGAGALLLGVVGIYGVMACVVGQRGWEIGIRLALGAVPRQVHWLFVRQGLVLAAVGIACGMGVAAWGSRLMSSLLFGIGPLDLVTYGAISVGLLGIAALASYVPVRRVVALGPRGLRR